VKLTFRVDYGNGPEDVTVSPAALIGYERTHATTVAAIARAGIGVGDMAELTWRQLQRDGRFAGSLDDYVDSLVELGFGDVTDPPSPSSDPSGASSPSSP